MAYVMMDSVREKEEQEGKTAVIVGVFVLPEREKSGDAVSYLSLFCLSLHQTSKFYLFCQTNYYAFFSSTRFLEFVYARPVWCCEL